LTPIALRPFFAPLRPELDPFLFAVVGQERNGIPLSTISALAQLGLDPWEEAGRLASLANRDAVERLTELIIRLPGAHRPLSEAREIAVALIDVLPPPDGASGTAEIPRQEARNVVGRNKAFWVICFFITAAAFLIMMANGNLPFGDQRLPAATDAPLRR
jgi:hypothetical protein